MCCRAAGLTSIASNAWGLSHWAWSTALVRSVLACRFAGTNPGRSGSTVNRLINVAIGVRAVIVVRPVVAPASRAGRG
jgi:hypothetical protein